jgi:hypothetical protein
MLPVSVSPGQNPAAALSRTQERYRFLVHLWRIFDNLRKQIITKQTDVEDTPRGWGEEEEEEDNSLHILIDELCISSLTIFPISSAAELRVELAVKALASGMGPNMAAITLNHIDLKHKKPSYHS